MIYREAELNEQALKHLEENEKYILDKLKLEEAKGFILFLFKDKLNILR